MVDFIAKIPQQPSQLKEPGREGWWILFVDKASRTSGSGIGPLLRSPIGEQLEQAIWIGFPASNNETEYKAILSKLNLALALSASKIEICSDSQLIVGHIQEEYKTKDGRMTQYLTKVRGALNQLNEWAIKRIPHI